MASATTSVASLGGPGDGLDDDVPSVELRPAFSKKRKASPVESIEDGDEADGDDEDGNNDGDGNDDDIGTS